MSVDRSATVAKPGISARQVFSLKRGDFWQSRCEQCGWSSGDLPCDSKGFAFHVGNLHKVLCKGSS
jgi:hypothetical protein